MAFGCSLTLCVGILVRPGRLLIAWSVLLLVVVVSEAKVGRAERPRTARCPIEVSERVWMGSPSCWTPHIHS